MTVPFFLSFSFPFSPPLLSSSQGSGFVDDDSPPQPGEKILKELSSFYYSTKQTNRVLVWLSAETDDAQTLL